MQQKIKEALASGFEHNEIDLKDLLVLLSIFGTAKSERDLEILVDLFKDDYEILKDIVVREKGESKTKLEKIVHEFISKIIKTNPAMALEIGKLALDKGMTIEELKKRFPEFRGFVEEQK